MDPFLLRTLKRVHQDMSCFPEVQQCHFRILPADSGILCTPSKSHIDFSHIPNIKSFNTPHMVEKVTSSLLIVPNAQYASYSPQGPGSPTGLTSKSAGSWRYLHNELSVHNSIKKNYTARLSSKSNHGFKFRLTLNTHSKITLHYLALCVRKRVLI